MVRSNLRGVRALATLGCLTLSTSLAMVGANAMGSGNHFEDAQVGLNYVVYQPLNTAGLTLVSFTLAPCGNNHDDALVARYTGPRAHFTLVEYSRTYSCSYVPKIAGSDVLQTIGKAGSSYLTATTLKIISQGLSTSQLASIVQSFSTKYPRPKQ